MLLLQNRLQDVLQIPFEIKPSATHLTYFSLCPPSPNISRKPLRVSWSYSIYSVLFVRISVWYGVMYKFYCCMKGSIYFRGLVSGYLHTCPLFLVIITLSTMPIYH
ncbi:hypothetical protein F4782DRAFT_380627 [Xylaria castorea]|nr:hypothetical protein F4782DRAFT_380627 [Xylaria castorea]